MTVAGGIALAVSLVLMLVDFSTVGIIGVAYLYCNGGLHLYR